MNSKLNANHLKLIAILAMTIDHIADLVFPGFPPQVLPFILHMIGRITAPVMWFFVCEGFYYTRNVKNTCCGWGSLQSSPILPTALHLESI